MTAPDDLDVLSSEELHDRAVHLAVRRLDVGFLWQLLKEIPASEAARGRNDIAGEDVMHLSAVIGEALGSGKGETAEALRPLYLEYLTKHSH